LKRGRTLDDASTDGGDVWVQALALAVCAQEGIDQRCNHLDPTSFSRTGAYVPDRDEHAMTITHGDAKDHRPDLKQAVLERMVSPDGGVPCVSQRGDGHTADIHVFQERAQALITAFEHTPSPRSLVADAKRYHADKAPHLKHMGFITRMSNTLGVVSPVIKPALTGDTWHPVDDHSRDQRLEFCHDGLAQRWLVVDSQAACERAAATLKHATPREDEALTKALLHRPAQRFPTPEAAQDALAVAAQRWQDHQGESSHLTEHPRDAGTGRPTPRTPRQASAWHIQVHGRPAAEVMGYHPPVQACLRLGTTISASVLSDPEVIAAYKSQSRVEGGVRWLTDPRCFVSSWLVKKPSRSAGLLRGMTLTWLVYAVTPRRLRQP
jgi:transposase